MSKTIPRTLKGFRDFLPADKTMRDDVERRVVEVFERFGFQPVETPTLEYASLILGKYGEDADRLVYTFEDRGGRAVALPYDQTVPSARVLSQYRGELPRYFRRYAIRNVFRAENPQKGRYREFKQCDIDIFGSTSPLADAEIVACTHAAFANVGFTDARLKLNDRQVLMDALTPFATADVDVFSIIRSVDKLDKLPATAVIEELVKKGLAGEAAEQALQRITEAQPSADLAAVLEATRSLGVPEAALEFTPTLARGLDYYTGVIFEVVVPEFSAGSLAGGGRYDGLIEQLGGVATPATGIAFGFDRMVEAATQLKLIERKPLAAEVLVTMFDQATESASLECAAALRAAGVRCEVYPARDKLGRQFKLADQKGIPLVLILGPDELESGAVTLRAMSSGEQQRVPVSDVATAAQALLAGISPSDS